MKLFLRRTLLGGLFVILPVTLIVIVLTRAVAGIRAALEPIAASLPFAALFPGLWVIVPAVLMLVLLCFITGLVLNLPFVRDWITAAQQSLVKHSPFTGTCAASKRASLQKAETSKFNPP